MIDIPARCFDKERDTGAKLVCKERGRTMVFDNPRSVPLDKIRIDGCVVTPAMNQKACDYLVRDSRERNHFVELKGRHIGEAFKQIEATIPLFILEGSPERFWCLSSARNSLQERSQDRK